MISFWYIFKCYISATYSELCFSSPKWDSIQRDLAHTQHFVKQQHLFCPNTHTNMYVHQGVRNVSLLENFIKWLIWSWNYKRTGKTRKKFLYKSLLNSECLEVEHDSL